MTEGADADGSLKYMLGGGGGGVREGVQVPLFVSGNETT